MLRLRNPFPGLSPYSMKLSMFYSGLSMQKSRFLSFCNHRNFVALQGSTGVGKTSFIKGEIFPELISGFTAKGKSKWFIAEMIPGKSPLIALAVAMARLVTSQLEPKEKSDPNLVQILESMLRGSKYGIIEIIEKYRMTNAGNILLFIDQLEELCLFNADAESNSASVEIDLFIDRVIEAIGQTAYPITIIAAVQSEHIGEFVRFPRLMQEIKDNSYSIQQPGRQDLFGLFQKINETRLFKIEDSFIRQLGDYYLHHEFIPGKFQHALSQCVDQLNRMKVSQLLKHIEHQFKADPGLGIWVSRRPWMASLLQNPGTLLELRAYHEQNYLLLNDQLKEMDQFQTDQRGQWEDDFHELIQRTEPIELTWQILEEIGGPDDSIEKQLEEIYLQLSEMEKNTCRLLFQSLAGTNLYGTFAIQRSVKEIMTITLCSEESLLSILRRFTNDRCGAIRVLPSIDVRSRLDQLEIILDPTPGKVSIQSDVTISQPVILQAWSRLKGWITEEHQNSLTYLDIVKDVANKEPFYEGIKLSTVWAWYEICKPHAGWAARYKSDRDTGFEVVKNFVLKSKALADRNQAILEDEKNAQLARSARMRKFIISGFIVAVLTGIVVLYLTRQAYKAQSAALDARELAKAETEKAEREKAKADSSKIMAAKAISDSRISRMVARQEQDSARKSKAEADRQNQIAQQALSEQREMSRRNELLKTELSENELFIRNSNLELDFLQRLSKINMISFNARRRVDSQLESENKIAANMMDAAFLILEKLEKDPYFISSLKSGRNPQGLQRAYSSARKLSISNLAQINQNIESPTRIQFENIRYGTSMDIYPGSSISRLVIGTDQNKIWRLDFTSIKDLDIYKFTMTEDSKIPGGLISGIRTVRHDLTGKNLFIGTVDGLIRFNQAKVTVRRSTENVIAIYPLADDEFISVGRAGTIGYFRDYKLVDSLVIENKLNAVDYSLSERYLVSNGKDNELLKVNLQPSESKSRFILEKIDAQLPDRSQITCLKIINSKGWLALGIKGGELLIIDLKTNRIVYRDVNRHFDSINAMELDEKNQLLITGGQDKIINVWNLDEFVISEANILVEPITFKELQPIMDLQLTSGGWFFALSRGQADEKINRSAAGRLSIWSTDPQKLRKRQNELRNYWVIPNFSLDGITSEP
ncbi:MAG: hypothetical protein ACO3FI_04285 [Cyclobacteriaceae bacterium]